MELTGHTAPQGAERMSFTGFDAKRLGGAPGPSRVNTSAFSPDGHLVVTGGADGTAQVYRCDVCGTEAGLLALAARRVTRRLTAAERERYLHEPAK
jgi:WD40 repeat protein